MTESQDKTLSSELKSELSSGPWYEIRLPLAVVPRKYHVFIFPNMKNNTLQGDVQININVLTATEYILLHVNNIEVECASLSSTDGSKEGEKHFHPIKNTMYYKPNQYYVIEMSKQLNPGKYQIFMKYRGTLASGTLGLYKTTYINALGDSRSCMLSYFEATYARSAFPCFDEPEFRAKFAIRIAYFPETGREVALSNMCREKDVEDYPVEGAKTTYFQTTPPMPTYLVAFMLGEFRYTPPVVSKTNVDVTVYSRPGLVLFMEKARDIAALTVDFFASYFGVPYTHRKLDLIALPDSNIGGMENWGLITFREDCLLLTEESTCDEQLRVVSIIGHEISHMWFGDLVSIKWWDNLWLKEGFATFMASVSGEELYPEWFGDWVMLRQTYSAMQMDASLGSHCLVQEVRTPAQIREVFDSISYEKGCCLIRMLEDLLPEKFSFALKNYLKRYAMSSTCTQMLWDEIQLFAEFDVSDFMNTWTWQMGFPLITVDVCHGTKILVSQSRCLLNKYTSYDPEGSPFKYKWNIPIRYVTSEEPRNVKLTWLKRNQQSVQLECPKDSNWIKINWHQVGFYRVNYTLDQWEQFSILLGRNPEVLDVEDRASLIDDAFNLAGASHFHYYVPLTLIRYIQYGKELHFFPWSVAAKYLQYLLSRFISTPVYTSFRNFIHLLIRKNLISEHIMEFNEEMSFLEKKLQLEIIKVACWSEEENTLRNVREKFQLWLNGLEKPHHELRSIIYTYGLSGETSVEQWERVLRVCLREENVKEKLSLWEALGNVKNVDLIKRLIELAKDENNLRSQDFFILLRSVVKHPIGLEVVWDFLREEWEYLVERFTLENMGLCSIVYLVCSQFGTESKLKETMAFFNKYPDAGAGVHYRERSIETIKVNIKWLMQHFLATKDWVENYNKSEMVIIEHEDKETNLLEVASTDVDFDAGHLESALVKSEPVVGQLEQAPFNPEPIVGQLEQAPDNSEPVVGQLEQAPVNSEPVVGQLEQAPDNSESVASVPEQAPIISDPVASEPEQAPIISDPVVSEPEQAPIISEPVASEPEKVAIEPEEEVVSEPENYGNDVQR